MLAKLYSWPLIGFMLRLVRSMWGMMSCRVFTHLSSENFERTLHLDERISRALHRKMCETCRNQERHMQQIHQLSAELLDSQQAFESQKLPDKFKSRLAVAVDKAAQETESVGDTGADEM